MKNRFAISMALVGLALAAPARAGDVLVIQKDKTFSQQEITIRSGDRVVFRNEDSVVHNLYSTSPGFEFEIKTQLPGQSADERFDGKGEADVRCAIHPQMKLRVKVDR
ncbi:MAG TPA: plastocyanin/azurin family copper-binding protein [Myxococcota bacterium]|jgi:plastocyanin